MDDRKFVVTPGLEDSVVLFQVLIDEDNFEPILIVGETGVGKSLFLKVLEHYYKQNKNSKNGILVSANCAHFGGGSSDLNIARAELFGINRGAIHGIKDSKGTKDIKGLVEAANGGILVLDEIGELPLEVQAMLLTFIETGKYRRVGESTERMARCQIIGSTNNISNLREDFYYRFTEFVVPPVHKRRIDIIYYIYAFDHDILRRLNSFDMLLLLTYNWPGNVREIFNVLKMFRRIQDFESKSKTKFTMKRLRHLLEGANAPENTDEISLIFRRTDFYIKAVALVAELWDTVIRVVDIDYIKKLFEKSIVNICPDVCYYKFKSRIDKLFSINEYYSSKFGVDTYDNTIFTHGMRMDLKRFCSVFDRDVCGKMHLLELNTAMLVKGHKRALDKKFLTLPSPEEIKMLGMIYGVHVRADYANLEEFRRHLLEQYYELNKSSMLGSIIEAYVHALIKDIHLDKIADDINSMRASVYNSQFDVLKEVDTNSNKGRSVSDEIIIDTMEKLNNVKSHVAKSLGISNQTVYNRLKLIEKKHGKQYQWSEKRK